jgi:hypothetical protein
MARSIWREVQFIYRILQKNILALGELLTWFSRISSILKVEKRIKRRELQLPVMLM